MQSQMPAELDEMDEAGLVCRSQEGFLDAFEELVFRYEHRIFAFVSQFCANPADAREVTQDTFVKAWQAITTVDPRRSLSSWLFTIARRKCIDRHRARPRGGEALSEEQVDPNDPAQLLSEREERDRLWRLARSALPDLQFQALWLRYVEDMDVAQIARVLHKTPTHTKVILFRARHALVEALDAGRVRAGETRPDRSLAQRPIKRPNRAVAGLFKTAGPG